MSLLVSENSLDHLNVVRNLASNNVVLAARGKEDQSLMEGGESKTTAERHPSPVSPGEIKRERNWESNKSMAKRKYIGMELITAISSEHKQWYC